MQKGFSGWRIVGAAGVLYALIVNFGLTASQLIIPAMAADPAVTMDRTMIGLGFTAFVLMQGLPGPVIGQFISRFGTKKAYAASAVLVMISGILLGLFAGTSTLAYVLLFGVMLSFSCTLGGQIAAQTTIGNWFARKRGLAMGIAMGIGGGISFFIPLLADAALGIEGNWRMGFYLISAVALVALLIVIVFIKDKPSDVGQHPDGIDPDALVDEGTSKGASRSRVYQTSNPKTSREAIRSLPFWLIMICSLSIFFALNMDISAGVLNFTGLGIDQGTIALGLSVQSIAMVVVNIAIAFLADRIEPARLLGACAFLTGLGAVFALTCTPGNTVMMFAYYILLGIGFGSNMSVMPTALANYFGMEHYPKIIGIALPVLSILSGFVPVIAGVVFDTMGTYVPMYVVEVAICAVGALGTLLIRYPGR